MLLIISVTINLLSTLKYIIFVQINIRSDPMNCVDFHCDEQRIATGSWDGCVRIWDILHKRRLSVSYYTSKLNVLLAVVRFLSFVIVCQLLLYTSYHVDTDYYFVVRFLSFVIVCQLLSYTSYHADTDYYFVVRFLSFVIVCQLLSYTSYHVDTDYYFVVRFLSFVIVCQLLSYTSYHVDTDYYFVVRFLSFVIVCQLLSYTSYHIDTDYYFAYLEHCFLPFI